jgi:hypothetical protein
MMIMCGDEMRFIKSISGTDITLDSNLTTAANYAENAVVYGPKYWTPTLGDYTKALYFNYEHDGGGFLVGPCAVNDFKVTNINARSGLRYDFGYAGETWTSSVVTPNTFNDVRASYGQPLVAVGATIRVNGTAINCDQLSFSPGVVKEPIIATSGANGLAGWANVAQGAPVVEFTEYYSSTRYTQFENSSEVPMTLQISVGASNAAKARRSIGIAIFNAQVETEEVELNGQRALKTKVTGLDPSTADIAAGITKTHSFNVFGGV